jgi:histidinol-phosphate phosphatase family protein
MGKHPKVKKKAVFLDRDGTLVPWVKEASEAKHMRPYRGAPLAVKTLTDLGYLVFVVTNQPNIGKGLITLARTKELNRALADDIGKAGGRITAFYVCPHRYGEDCKCRKPSPYFLKMAARKFRLDLKQSFMVGDSTRDTRTGKNAGTRTILVRTGIGGKGDDRKFFDVEADHTVKDLAAAARLIARLTD